jgi:dTDP-4-amino-4,6-dideoxygalactose transaminase
LRGICVVGEHLDWLAVAQIPLVDVKAQYTALLDELKERIAEVLDSGRFILGPNVRAFEEEAAAYLGVEHAIGVANGTDALVLALDALGIGEGDEVICPSFTFYATAEAVVRRGATPVFAEIDPQTMNLDPSDVGRRVTPKTKAIMPVHLFGRPAPLEALAELGVPLVEDAAQAFGAQGTGRTGVASTYSFFPTKNLFAFGDGGLVSTDDDELAERLRLLRFHGSKAKKEFELIGYNSRLDELQAAVLRVFLPHLEEWNRSRREAAARYAELGLGEVCELPTDEPAHVYHVFAVRSPERDRIAEHLAANGIASTSYYETPLHRQPALQFLGQAEEADFPETERASRENLALPMWSGIGADVQEQVVAAVREAVSLEAVR